MEIRNNGANSALEFVPRPLQCLFYLKQARSLSKTYTIYHNPRCSKSRNTLTLLQQQQEQQDFDIDIVHYIDNPPTVAVLQQLLDQLDMSARQLMRTGESEYKDNNLKDSSLSEQQLLAAMQQFPRLIERPIVSDGQRAIVGRPPENLMHLFD